MKKYISMSTEEKKALAKSELIRISNLIGKTPTKNDYIKIEDAKITYGQIIYLYKKWNSAIKDAGLKPNKSLLPLNYYSEIDKNEIINAFIDVANQVKKMPTYREFKKYYNISLSSFLKTFGNWNMVKQYVYTHHRERLTFLPPRITVKRNRRTKAQIEADRKKARNG
ncbi:MAG TPA: hypothetical protein PLY32_04380 [Salinivirgaceae bacterium]|nr:hypothetical protein [Salinivirgaceae bacterium]HQA76339.1 hypothetical protein [Salinivirgaceae bacterium]